MKNEPPVSSRREFLRRAGAGAGGAVLTALAPEAVRRHAPQAVPLADRSGGGDAGTDGRHTHAVGSARRENIFMLSGPGGNVVVLQAPDGKFVVDGFVSRRGRS